MWLTENYLRFGLYTRTRASDTISDTVNVNANTIWRSRRRRRVHSSVNGASAIRPHPVVGTQCHRKWATQAILVSLGNQNCLLLSQPVQECLVRCQSWGFVGPKALDLLSLDEALVLSPLSSKHLLWLISSMSTLPLSYNNTLACETLHRDAQLVKSQWRLQQT